MVLIMNKSKCPMAGETVEQDFCYHCDFYFGSEKDSRAETIVCRYPACGPVNAPADLRPQTAEGR